MTSVEPKYHTRMGMAVSLVGRFEEDGEEYVRVKWLEEDVGRVRDYPIWELRGQDLLEAWDELPVLDEDEIEVRELEIAKSNWTGEKAKVQTYGNCFRVYDTWFRIKEERFDGIGGTKFTVYCDDLAGGWPNDVIMADGFLFDDDSAALFRHAGVERSHENPIVAASQVLFNTI